MRKFKIKKYSRIMAGITLAVALMFSVSMLSACSGGGNYGRLIGARDSYRQMLEGPIGADYRGYKTPQTDQPNVVIAIQKNYTLADPKGDWTPVEIGQRSFRQLNVKTREMGDAPLLQEIRGPGGQHVGLWYSVYENTVVKMPGDKQVQVDPPAAGGDVFGGGDRGN